MHQNTANIVTACHWVRHQCGVALFHNVVQVMIMTVSLGDGLKRLYGS